MGTDSISTRFFSLGTRLALKVSAVLAVVSLLLSLSLLAREHANLTTAKRNAADMVSDLFAASLVAPLDLGEAEDIQREVNNLGLNSEVQYASVWKTGARGPSAELRRAGGDFRLPTPAAFDGPPTVVSHDHVRVVRKVVSPDGRRLGTAVVGFSLARENAAYASSRNLTLWWALCITAGTVLVIMWVVRRQVVVPVERLLGAVRKLERGEPVPVVEVTENHEVGRLARAFNATKDAIADRESRLEHANRDLVQREDRLRRLAENASDIIYRVSYPGHRFEYVSPAAAAVMGRSPEDHYADPDLWFSLAYPKDRRKLEGMLESVRPTEDVPIPIRFVRPDGSMVWTEHVVSPIKNAAGQVVTLEGIARDVTDHQTALQARERSEASFRGLIEATPDAITVFRQGRLSYANPAAIALLSPSSGADLARRPLEDFVHTEDQRMFARPAKQHPDWFDCRLVRVDGSIISAEVARLAVVLDNAPAELVLAHDVTERNRLRAQLMQSDRLASMGVLAAGIAHEINNPLTYVLSNLGFVLDELADLSKRGLGESVTEIRGMVKEARDGAQRVRKIVRDLKSFARPDENTGSSDVLSVLDTAATMATGEYKRRARLVKNYGDDIPLVQGDEGRLGQVFLNLLLNAAQAIPDGAPNDNEIRLTVRKADNMVVAEVRDTGPGIPQNLLERIFDPFYTTKPVGVGTGLGLFVCNRIIAALSGTIEVESTLGKGTCFRVTLPVAGPESRPLPPQDLPRLTATRTARVLVCDDEPLIGKALERILREHDVVTTTSGRQALDILRKSIDFDLVFCDLMTSDLGGADLYEAIKGEYPGYEHRFVFMTGGAPSPNLSEFLRRIDNAFVEKPFVESAVRSLVSAMLAGPTNPPS